MNMKNQVLMWYTWILHQTTDLIPPSLTHSTANLMYETHEYMLVKSHTLILLWSWAKSDLWILGIRMNNTAEDWM